MAIYNYTRRQLRHQTARLCADLITGTASSPAAGSFVCTSSSQWEKGDDYFNEWIEVYCYSGAGAGTSGKPKTWTNATHTLTFAPAATLTAGDLIEMHQRFTVNEYNEAMNLAIERVAKEALFFKSDASIVLAEGSYAYNLPPDMMYITELEIEGGAAGLYDGSNKVDLRAVRIIPGAAVKIELMGKYFTPAAGRHLRIRGYASPSILDTDNEECPINPFYIANQAAALLHQSRIRRNDVDEEYHTQQMTLCQAQADLERANMRVSPGGIPCIE